jgi:hypothetical protein
MLNVQYVTPPSEICVTPPTDFGHAPYGFDNSFQNDRTNTYDAIGNKYMDSSDICIKKHVKHWQYSHLIEHTPQNCV